MRRKNSFNRGFTLPELLLAMAILAFTIVALLGFFVSCIFLNESSRNLTIATSHAQFALEEAKNTNFTSIQNATWDNAGIISRGLVPLTAETIVITVSGSDPKDVRATVNWQDRGLRNISISLETLIAEQ